jgi:type II secretory ATPase GspE/PulE/Tfp pilus assembly ATPase PilB-like protein
LARTICPSCATKYYPEEHVLRDAGIPEKAGRPFKKGGGCRQCHDTGYRGRVGIYEVMEVTPNLRRMIHLAAPSHELREKWRGEGGLTLREEGVLVALEDKSTLEEVLSVTHSEGEHTAAMAKAAA